MPSFNVQNAKALSISEGDVKTIHDSNGQLLWGAVGYSTKYEGDTEQTTYTGKNLFNINSFAQGSVTVTNDVAEGTMSEFYTEFGENTSGLTFINPNEQISVSLSAYTDGNATTSGNGLAIYANYTDSTTEIILRFRNSDTTYTTLSGYTDSSKTLSKLTLGYGSGSSNNWHIKDFQIEKGSTVTDYEPYVGGIPSPNPSYPQDINVVTGEQTVKVTGKNLFDGITRVGDFSINGVVQPQTTSRQYAVNYISVLPNTQYASNMSINRVVFYDKNKNFISRSTFFNVTTFTTLANAYYIRFDMLSTYTPSELQLEKGSTATTYEPYQSQRYEVNLGKNLWGGFVSSVQRTSGSIDFTNNADGSISVSAGTASAQSTSLTTALAVSNTHYITLKAGSYIVSGGTTSIGLQVLDTDGNLLGTSTFTLTVEKQVYVRTIIENGVTVAATTIKPQLELGTTATTYAPYFTPIELCKIGTYQDYIWKDGADWKVHKATGKMVLDGTEGSWNRVQVSGATRYFTVDATGALIVSDTSLLTPVVCDNFTSQTPSNIFLAIPDYGISLNTETAKFRFRDKDYTETSDFKTWLTTHNTTVYYALATATDTTITDATLIGQLNAIEAWLTRYGYSATVSGSLPLIINQTALS